MLKNQTARRKRYVSSNVVNQNVYDYSGIANIKEKDEGIKMTTKKIVPKTTNLKMVIEDKQVQAIIKDTPKKDLENTINSLTRDYLRKKYPNKPIEGLERVDKITQPCWYTYE